MLPTLLDGLAFLPESLTATPDEDFFSNSLLDIISDISDEAADFVTDIVDDLDDVVGELIVDSGIGTIDLQLPDIGAITTGFDLPSFLADVSSVLTAATGSLSFSDGLATGSLAVADAIYAVEGFDFAGFLAAGTEDFITSLDVTTPIENGAFLIDISTLLGPISGSIDIAGGSLDIDITSFAGDIATSIDFDESAVFPFLIPTAVGDVEAVLNLDAGTLEAPLFGQVLSVPLSSLSGSATLSGGTATLDIDTDLGPVSTSFEVGPLASELVADTLTGLSGEVSLTDGLLSAAVGLGDDVLTVDQDLAALATELIELVGLTSGSLGIADGLISGELLIGDTPFVVDETIDDLVELIGTPIGELV